MIAAELGSRLQAKGICFAPAMLDAAEQAMVADCFHWSAANPSDNANVFEPTERQPGRFYADINHPRALAKGGPYRRLLERSSLGRRLSEMWGGSPVWFLYEQVLLKEGAEARRTPWHQDSSYLPIAGDMLAIVWMTLDPVSRDCALEFVAGSHRGPLYDGSSFAPGDDTAPLYGGDAMPRLPEIEGDRDAWPIVGWATDPGDAVIFHPATLHGGAPTVPGMTRRTVSLRFFGEDAIYRPLPMDGVATIGIEGETLWKRLAGRLRDGDPLRDEAMPLICAGG